MKFLEYEISSGRIVSVITAKTEPETSSGFGLMRIGDNEEIDINSYSVRDGLLVKTSETNAERIERERLKRERAEQSKLRLKSMMKEFILASLDDNQDEIKELRREFKTQIRPFM